MTDQECEQLNHIKTSEIIQDIKDIEREVKDYEDELEILKRNPVNNKVRIYMNKGKVIQGKELIEKLNKILEYRRRVDNLNN
jgi:hypothetical protein